MSFGSAEDVSITDAGGFYTGTDVEAALQEVGGKLFFVDGGGSLVKFRSGKVELRNNAGAAGLLLDAGGDIDMSGSGYVALGANNYASGGANTDKHYLYGGHGLVVPTLAADPASGASEEGQIYFNTTSQTFRGYDGTVWGELALT